MLQTLLNTHADQATIHEKSLEILNTTGVVFHHQPALDLLKKHGASINGQVALIPPELVENCLKNCRSEFTLAAINETKNAQFGKKNDFLVLPNLGPIFIQDTSNGRRHGLMEDYIKITKLSQVSDFVDVVGSCPIDTADITGDTKYLQMLYQTCRFSDKPIMCCTSTPQSMDLQLELLSRFFGSSEVLKQKTVTGTSLSPLTPLAFSEDASYALMKFSSLGQMVIIAGAPMSGISAPVSMSGTSLIINVEFLAGMVLAQCMGPGTPVVYATTASAANLQNASYVTGIPETTLLNSYAAQMGQYYQVPTRSVGTATDSKTLDMQAGLEAMQNLLFARLCGVDAIYETLGTLDSLMSISYEKFMIDLETISRVKLISKGVDTSEDQLFTEDISKVGIGGNFLTQASTLSNCRTRWKPSVSDFKPFEKWIDSESREQVEKTSQQMHGMLAQVEEPILDTQSDREIRSFISACD